MEAASTDTPKRSPFFGVAGLCVLNIIAAVDATALSVAIPVSKPTYYCPRNPQ